MYNIGIDLGGTNIKVGIVDEQYHILGRSNVKTSLPRPEDEIIQSIAEAVMLACADANIAFAETANIGIGSPGAADRLTGVIIRANNLGFKDTPIGEKLEKKLNRRVYVENDANAAAYGEYLNGSGKGYSSLVVVTLGTGVGSGIILDGKIYTGFNFCGGEMGHTVIDVDGPLCSCGRKGCFEMFCSASALIRQTKDAMNMDFNSEMWRIVNNDIENVDGKTAFDGMRAGDKTATALVDSYILHLGCGLTNIVNTFQPEVLLIGGGICKEGDTLIQPLAEYIDRECYSVRGDQKTKLLAAKLGNDAGIIGAANLYQL